VIDFIVKSRKGDVTNQQGRVHPPRATGWKRCKLRLPCKGRELRFTLPNASGLNDGAAQSC